MNSLNSLNSLNSFITFLALLCLTTFQAEARQPKTVCQTWRMTELSFVSDRNYASSGADEVLMDVRFTHKKTGETLTRPAFWDGDSLFLVRFAPTMKGTWTWETVCRQDASLNGRKGTLNCRKYSGDLAVYQHGFIRTEAGKKYFIHADGTPFFYLGDTHWGLYTEEFDEPGPHAGQTGAYSHFKYIVDRRAEQGFTVLQSEPIGARFNLRDGRVDQKDIAGFRDADRYYRYIADKGLVHANAEFFFVSALSAQLAADDKALERLARYWVARFGAWPVMWTLAQEIDNDFYHERGDHNLYDFTNNPWVKIAELIHRHDAYSHPLSGHQENAWHTTVTGQGTGQGVGDNQGASAFAQEEVGRRTGHSWWAAQWSPNLTKSPEPDLVLDYWNSPRPAVNYEGRYCYLWTKDFGSRAQGWIAFLSGFCGYGYGAIDIWLYQSKYDINTTSNDGIEDITPEDKQVHWSEAVEFPSAHQMTYLRHLMETIDWWNLVPVLPRDEVFQNDSNACACARTPDTCLLYFYSKDQRTGRLADFPARAPLTLTWFNPRTGQTLEASTAQADEDGSLTLPQRPDAEDWVLLVKRRKK